MKNYATPCAFYGTKPEREALEKPLQDLGYEKLFTANPDDAVLMTDIGTKNQFGNFSTKGVGNRISAPASNIPLCLALAAMVEGDVLSRGELYYDKASKTFEKVVFCDGETLLQGNRKATVPEIFAHFGLPFEREEKKEEVREIVGYKAPFDLYGGKIKKGSVFKKDPLPSTYSVYSFESKPIFTIASEIVETWEPVYKKVNKIRVEAGEYTKEELQKLIEAKYENNKI